MQNPSHIPEKNTNYPNLSAITPLVGIREQHCRVEPGDLEAPLIRISERNWFWLVGYLFKTQPVNTFYFFT